VSVIPDLDPLLSLLKHGMGRLVVEASAPGGRLLAITGTIGFYVY
jgi:hypothetical protein